MILQSRLKKRKNSCWKEILVIKYYIIIDEYYINITSQKEKHWTKFEKINRGIVQHKSWKYFDQREWNEKNV